MNNTSKTILAFVGGALAGAAVGILLSPEKGSNLRRKIADQARDLTDDLSEAADEKYQEFLAWKNRMRDRATDEVDSVKDNVRERVDRVRRTVHETADQVKRTANTVTGRNTEEGTDNLRRNPPKTSDI
ncbi:MAG TPA: YtxH domain-containing protein [Bacteroidia bacterium]|nr:YtxH domain-containing protein [Bacteroidia bacterium]